MEKKIEEIRTAVNKNEMSVYDAYWNLLEILDKKSSLPTDETQLRDAEAYFEILREKGFLPHEIPTNLTEAERWKRLYYSELRLRTNFSSENKWISVEDRLPENHERYLCRAMLSNCFVDAVCLFDKDSQFYRWLYENKEVEVTHWQPLPNPPKQEQQTTK